MQKISTLFLSLLPLLLFSQEMEKIGSDVRSVTGKISIRTEQNVVPVRENQWVWDQPKFKPNQIVSIKSNELTIEMRLIGSVILRDASKIAIIVDNMPVPVTDIVSMNVDGRVFAAVILLSKEGRHNIVVSYESIRSEPLSIEYARPAVRRNLAIFFPVTTYTGSWQPLTETLTESQAIAKNLETIYGFSTQILHDKNKAAIKAKLGELAIQAYGEEDQLLLFFTMHGHFDEAGDVGCLVPFGGASDDPTFDTWLLHTELRALVTRIPCKHILLALDACYSGTFSGAKSKPDAYAGSNCAVKVANALNQQSRLYITAGGKEKVPASSNFARLWQSALESRGGEDGLLTFPELQGRLSESDPAPRWGEFTGHMGGGFVFVPKESCK